MLTIADLEDPTEARASGMVKLLDGLRSIVQRPKHLESIFQLPLIPPVAKQVLPILEAGDDGCYGGANGEQGERIDLDANSQHEIF